MKKIAIFGSSNMDYTVYQKNFPLEGETIYGISRFIQPGGKGANQAVAVANTGLVESHFFTSLGNDNDGKEIENILKKFNLKLHVKQSQKNTGNATILVNEKSENEIIIIEGANSDWNTKDLNKNIFKKFNGVILQNEIPSKINELIINECFKLKIPVFYNPAPYREISLNILKKIDTIILNEIELKQISKKKNIDEGIKILLDIGIKNILVTLGKNGSIFKNANQKIKVEANVVKAVDTVGAGDTYIGYFVASLISGKSIKDSMIFASKASALAVTKKGSLISIPFGINVFKN